MKNTGSNITLGGFILINLFILMGVLTIYFSWNTDQHVYNNFYEYFYQDGISFIFGMFFILFGIYGWIMTIINVLFKPKKEVLYLSSNDENIFYFLNKKGKKFIFQGASETSYELYSFYLVSKTRDIIHNVIEKSNEIFEVPDEKISYWMGFYSKYGSYEDISLLPIAYVLLLPGVLSFLLAEGYDKLYGLVWSICILYFIIYDLVYKISNRRK